MNFFLGNTQHMNKLTITLNNINLNIFTPPTHNNPPPIMPSNITSNTPTRKNSKIQSNKTCPLYLSFKKTNKVNIIHRQQVCNFKQFINIIKSPNILGTKINH